MYSNLKLYYLDHMGITPWVKRESTIPLQATADKSVKLVIVLPDEPKGKTQTLFKQLLTYINIADSDLQIIKTNEDMSIITALEQYKPQILLSLGKNVSGLNISCPIFEGFSLDHLLAHPLSKKVILQKIIQIKSMSV